MRDTREFIIRNGILLKYNGTANTVVIPSHVKAIGNRAFESCRQITELTIPEGVVSIGVQAFRFCNGLTRLHIPDSVTSIGEAAFMWCKNLKELVLPRGLTHISMETFWACYSLSKITFPESITTIGASAFTYCEGMEDLLIPGSVRSIGHHAFYGCTGLAHITIEVGPQPLEMDFRSVFEGCTNIEAILAPGISLDRMDPLCKVAAAVGYLVCSQRFEDPAIIEAHRNYIRRQKKRVLQTLFAADLVELLEELIKITGITLSNFESVFLQPAMEAEAHECVAFLMDWKQQHITPEMLEKQLQRELTKDPYNTTDMKKLWSYKKLSDGTLSLTGYKGEETDISIPPRIGTAPVTDIDASAFDCEKGGKGKKTLQLQSVYIPEGVIRIGYHAFYKCEQLTQIAIANTVKSIGPSAFLGCKALTSVEVPQAVTFIGDCAFFGCDSLKDITVANSVTFIGNSAFPRTATVRAATGSYALNYAKRNRIPFTVK